MASIARVHALGGSAKKAPATLTARAAARSFAAYAAPGESGAPYAFKKRYDNFIGGKWTPPVKGDYFEVVTPTTGKVFTQAARGTAEDIEVALDAAHKAAPGFGSMAAAARSNLLLKIADVIESNLERLAYVETIDNGKPIRETLNADIPLAADHFRYFAGVLRAQEGAISQLDADTVAYHTYEPLGVVGQIIPWNFPILMAAWKLAPALAAGNAIVLKPAESTPISVLVLFELIGSILPPGTVNIVNGYGKEAGAHLANSKRIAKIAFTGSTAVGRTVAQAAAANLIPATLELGGKSPNVFFADVMDKDDAYFDKALEGLALFAFNSGEVCTCPSRALIEESIYERFMDRAVKRVKAIKMGNPLDTETMLGAQNSKAQYDKISKYLDIGKAEGAQCLTGGAPAKLPGAQAGGYYIQPTIFKGHNKMRIFQEEIFGPVLAVTTFKTEEEALAIANDTSYGLGAGVWSRDINKGQRMAQSIHAGRVWLNNMHAYPSHAAFGGYKESGIGRETYKSALTSYQQVKCTLASYSPKALGFF